MLEFLNKHYGIIISIFSFSLTVWSIYIIVKNLQALKNQNETTIKSARDERFKNAIDQLGSDKNPVVLGSIYTLHRIAKEEITYRENVFNIFCAYIRDTTTTKEYQEKYKDKPAETIQTILNLICVNEKDREIYKGFIINLEGSYLAGCTLENVCFVNSKLNGVNFSKSDLNKINFLGTQLNAVDFRGALLTEIDFVGSYLMGVIFEAFLMEVNFIASNLCNSNFLDVKLLSNIKFKSVYDKIKGFDTFDGFINFCINKKSELGNINGLENKIKQCIEKEILDILTQEEADKIIADYRKVMKDIEKAD